MPPIGAAGRRAAGGRPPGAAPSSGELQPVGDETPDLWLRINRADVGKLARIQGVKALWPVVEVKADVEPESAPELATALAMTGADIAQSQLGYTGQGIRVAIVDTGIDYNHPDLGGCFGPGCRVTTGYDFVGDAFNADSTSPSYNPVPVPDPNPDDCAGHGTHVAGIVGANGAVKGVAPDVTFPASSGHSTRPPPPPTGS